MRTAIAVSLLLLLSMSHSGCFSDDTVETYYGHVSPPHTQEFRWSDGGIPQVFDPAFAAAPPDTDLIRAIFEGLTDYDPRTLQPIPAVATRWESSRDGKVWTFYLREDARWSNGEPVTANDFVQSWERTVRLGDLAPHTELLRNIEGATSAVPIPKATENASRGNSTAPKKRIGAEAMGAHVLRVHLQHPDLNFPSLVAHPVFRPVKIQNDSLNKLGPNDLVSNGAFLVTKTDADGVQLERAQNYWGKDDVSLDRVSFVESKNPEEALNAYRQGKVDAVTNAAFEPLAIKLLSPYRDFHRATYGALTYYSFNTSHAPFDDVRVREALAISIDRDRISQDDLGGATESAKKFLPDEMANSDKPVVGKSELLEKDIARAKQLLSDAGFPDGQGFPRIRLLINRNEQQRLVSQSIVAMWRANLNIDTEIVIKNWDEYETAIRAGDFDLVRRGLVMQTTDELTNMRMMFRQELMSPQLPAERNPKNSSVATPNAKPVEATLLPGVSIESEEQALRELPAVPIYFASSYSLVKPYVVGFDSNVLDAPSLKAVKVETTWKIAN